MAYSLSKNVSLNDSFKIVTYTFSVPGYFNCLFNDLKN